MIQALQITSGIYTPRMFQEAFEKEESEKF
jgi:hypothetical protein